MATHRRERLEGEAFARVYSAFEAAPTVCVWVGNVLGAGAEIAAGCDLRVGGDNLRLAWAGARMGAPVGPARLLPLVGLAAAKDLVLTGRTIGMDEGRALGLLHRTAPGRRRRPRRRRSRWPARSPPTIRSRCAR
jgi:enoyl-CoA hydratase